MCHVTILTSEWRECTSKVHDYVMSKLQFYRDSDRPASNRCYSVQISRHYQIQQQLYKHTLLVEIDNLVSVLKACD